MSKLMRMAFVISLFLIVLLAFQWNRTFVVIHIEDALRRESVPTSVFEKATQTKVEAWSGRSIALIRGPKRLGLTCNECFVMPCDNSSQIRFLTIHSYPLTQTQLESLHADYCSVFDANEHSNTFADWASSDHKDLVSMNTFDGSRIYSFSVHRTYDTTSPWFASIGVAWRCNEEKSVESE